MLSIKRLSLADAHTLIEGAEARSREIGVPMCIAVTDESGNLVAFSRMDGSKVLSISLSADKAFTSAISRRPTHEYNELCQPGSLVFGIHTSSGGRFSIVGGGLPVLDGEDVIGAIGCSSGTPEQDRECAQAAIDRLQNA
ncbi:MAG: heme-binding protein [Rhodospirillaceae bacterium]|nr:heme-binding protein [Rhodospirillaceae bacterium]